MMKNALSSRITSIFGGVAGMTELVLGLEGLWDNVPETGVIWSQVIIGLGLLVMGLAARDGNVTSKQAGAE